MYGIKKGHFSYFIKIFLCLFIFSITLNNSLYSAKLKPVKIGVLATHSRYESMQKWSATAIYLTRNIRGYQFEIIPLLFNEIDSALQQNKIDFLISNPSIYIEAEIKYDADRIATLKNLRAGRPFTKFGGVLFCKANRSDIQTITDLEGKTFSAVDKNSLGGWQAAWLTLKKAGIDPFEDFKSIRFTGSHDQVIYDVRDGRVDAGTVRTDALEQLSEKGEINLTDFRIFPHNQHLQTEKFPFLHSTALYPEWPFAQLPKTSKELAQKVAIALLQMPMNSEAAQNAHYAGWSIPLNYHSVRTCMQALQIGPYAELNRVSIWQFIVQNKLLSIASGLFLLIIIGFLLGTMRLNSRLHRAKEKIVQELHERKQLEVKLLQAQKLEAIGQLAAGIAHEINTPSQFINDNLTFLQDSFLSINTVLHRFKETKEQYQQGRDVTANISALEELIERSDLDFLETEVPDALQQSLQGLDRIRKIVKAMKEFSHPSGNEQTAADINQAIENTIIVSKNEWKYVAELKTELDPSLPAVPCFIDEFNQVILNIIVNASHAIQDKVGNSGEKGTITISTKKRDETVEIKISDTGTGIPKEIQHRIFDPFFTTKEVGKGTGQGLAIAHSVITQKHHGTLKIESEPGKGSTFIIELPLRLEYNKIMEQ